MSGDHDKYHGTAEAVKDEGVYLTKEEFSEILTAFDDAVYLLKIHGRHAMTKSSLHRHVTALEKLWLKGGYKMTIGYDIGW